MGVGFGGGEQTGAIALALGIALQNLPEGFVVAVALRNLNYSPPYALGLMGGFAVMMFLDIALG